MRQRYPRILIMILFLAALCRGSSAASPKYLAFQFFTGAFSSHEMGLHFPPAAGNLMKTVSDLRDRIGTKGADERRLGFFLGPLAFDNTDEQVRELVGQMFDVSLKTGVAGGLHVDDSMFWGRLAELNTTDNVEWLDWDGTLNTGRRLDWSSTPTKIMPQLCVNSAAVKAAVAKRAALIGVEVIKGIKRLKAAGKESLFMGIIAGWETQIGRDFDTGKSLGYHALTNAGFSARNPPPDIDRERVKIIGDFIDFWASSLVKAGVPEGKVYSHIAFMSDAAYQMMSRGNPSQASAPYLGTVGFTPPETAFSSSCVPGLSTYPQPGLLEEWQTELKKHGNPPWASCEGTSIDPSEAERGGKGVDMEGYLGNLYNHGAILVNVFGWGVGDGNNPFRKIAEGAGSLAAYRRFLAGEKLAEAPLIVHPIPPANLAEKVHAIQALLPAWIERHGTAKVRLLAKRMEEYLKLQEFQEASKAADEILALIEDTESKP
jgi:hypothetical protein